MLPALGIDPRFLTNKQGPCPMCEGRDRFRWDNKDGDGTFFCNHCGAGDGIRLVELKNGCGFKEAVALIEAVLGDAPLQAAKRRKTAAQAFDAMKRVWAQSETLTLDTVAGRYLRARTGLITSTADVRAAAKARHIPSNSDWPALFATVRASDGTAVNLHRTFLSPHGGKAPVEPPRMTMEGDLPDGCAVRLCAHGAVLGIAEGIETALSATALTATPCWAALNAGRLAVWWPPEGVTSVVIFGDNDDGFAGQAAAYALAKRLRAKKIEAAVRIPVLAGWDWNDVLQHQSKEAA